MKNVKRFLVIAFAFVAVSAHAATTIQLPYLIKGVHFAVNSSRVRMRQQPGVTAAILGVLDAGTEVIPFEVSSRQEALTGGAAYPWYRCLLAGDMKTAGWIYGQYLSCTLDTAEETLHVHYLGMMRHYAAESTSRNADSSERADLWLQFYYSFRGGRFSPAIQADELATVEAAGDYRVRAGDQEIARIAISGTYPATFPEARGTLVHGGFGSMPYIKCVLGKDIQMGSRSQFQSWWDDSRTAAYKQARGIAEKEFRRLTGATMPPPGDQDSSELQAREDFEASDFMDNGTASSSHVFYYKFSGVFRGQGLRYTCFLVYHPDRSMTLTMTDYTEWESTNFHDEIAARRVGIRGDLVAASTDHLPGFPTSFFNVTWAEKDGNAWGLAVTNGYVVYVLGPVATMGSGADLSNPP